MRQHESHPAVPMNDTPGSPRIRESDESIPQRVRERANCERDIHPAAEGTLQWKHDSWIDECEAAGVYSRKAPAFDAQEKPSLTATLTRAEAKLLAQRHLNTVASWRECSAWTGVSERYIEERVVCHDIRFQQLAELLPLEDQQRFRRQIEIRDRYIASVRAEVLRCEIAEGQFWEQVDAGLVSEDEIASHKTPPFIAGLPVVPSPADGGPGPETWDLFS